MLMHWLLREPALCLRISIYLCAGLLFPIHLGWIGTPWPGFLGYLVTAAFVLSTPIAVQVGPLVQARWQALLLLTTATLVILALPASTAFWIGSAVGPIDEAMDDEICAAQGLGESDTAGAEANDTIDVTPDCTRSE